MTKSPMVWGAGLACALGGAIAGNAVGSTPIIDRSVFQTYYQSHQATIGSEAEQRALPDHYPLETRSGVVPVAELSDRGLFSQRRYRSFDIAADYSMADAADGPGESFVTDAGLEVGENPLASPEPMPQLALADRPAQIAGSAKMISVEATLAMR